MHHALLSLMLMAGACGESPGRAILDAPAVVSRCELPSAIADLFAQVSENIPRRGVCDSDTFEAK